IRANVCDEARIGEEKFLNSLRLFCVFRERYSCRSGSTFLRNARWLWLQATPRLPVPARIEPKICATQQARKSLQHRLIHCSADFPENQCPSVDHLDQVPNFSTRLCPRRSASSAVSAIHFFRRDRPSLWLRLGGTACPC